MWKCPDFGKDIPLPLARPGMTIGLLGGSFDPPHQGHKGIAEAALKRLGLSRIWWLVSPGNPLKQRTPAALSERLAQVRTLARHPAMVVTALEAALGTTYTVDTVTWLTHRFPWTRFLWIMGADNMVQISQWRNWQKIFHLVPVLVVDRPGFRFRAMSSQAAHLYRDAFVSEACVARLPWRKPPAWSFLSVPLQYVSSTELRAQRGARP